VIVSIALRLLFLLAVVPRLATTQGVTTAAIHGMVTQADGQPIHGAIVRVTNESNGRRWEVGTGSTGRFFLEDIAVGGPYRIEVRTLGFAPEARGGIFLALGQRLTADFSLRPSAITLSPVTVTAAAHPILNAGRTGPAEIVSRAEISRLPNPGRQFLALTTLSPQTAISRSSGVAPTGGITISGQNRFYNSFQIDGGVNHDLYRGRLPGQETLPRPIALDALEEIQVLAAPFDVRHGTFAGGLVNAVTRSGTNEVRGSVFGSLSDGALVGSSVTGDATGDFRTWQFGGTVGGPIVRNRAHYFVSVDVQHEVVPDPGPLVTDTAGGADMERIGISYESAARFLNILRDSFQLDPGTLDAVDGQVRARDVLGKVSVQLGTNSHLELSHHYTSGDRWDFISRTKGFYFPSASTQRNPSNINASRLIWTSLLGRRWSNELIVSRLRLEDSCRPGASFGLIRVLADAGQLTAGAAGGCPTHPINSVVQGALEITENLTAAFGAHVVTFGIHGEALRFRDDGLQASSGIWEFASLDLLETRRAMRYEHTLPGPERTGGLDFRAHQLGVYMQDRWAPKRGLTLTLGLRADASILPNDVTTNTPLKSALGMDTGRLPSGLIALSPRLGVNYDVRGVGRTFVRGGIGLFTGRPPYTWIGNAYRDNGMQELFLSCTGPGAPRFDPASQPAVCANGTGPVPRLSLFDPAVKLPQNLKLALGVDHEFPRGVVGTVDVLYTRAVHQMYLTDANLLPPIRTARGEGDRLMYGTISCATTPCASVPARRDTAFGQVVRVSDRSGDHSFSLSAQLRKRFGARVDGNAFYAYTRARDRMSLVNPAARANLANTSLNGTLEDRPLRTSYFEIPHRVQVSATARLPFQARLTLLYAGASGTPYTYIIVGDANADGIGGTAAQQNDLVYVPRDSSDISLANPAGWDSLAAHIEAEPCLREQRGRIMERNSCRNPWFGSLNARLTKAFRTRAGQSLELTADVYNVLNLLNRHWGEFRMTAPDPWFQMLRLTGYDASKERGVYRLQLRPIRRVHDFESRWRLEMGVRYVF
jgi:hypothetical protein